METYQLRKREMAAHLQVSTGLDGLVQRHDDLLPACQIRHGLQVLCDGLSRDGEAAAVYEAVLQQQLHHRRRATHL